MNSQSLLIHFLNLMLNVDVMKAMKKRLIGLLRSVAATLLYIISLFIFAYTFPIWGVVYILTGFNIIDFNFIIFKRIYK